MDPNTQPDIPATAPPVTPHAAAPGMPVSPESTYGVAAPAPPVSPIRSRGTGMQRTVLPAAVSALLLVGGAVAVVSAASPEPSTSATPSATDGTAPSTRPDRAAGDKADCPNEDDGTTGSGDSDGSTTTPDTSPDPAPTTDPSPATTPLT